MKPLLLWVLVLIICLPSLLAMGISPGKTALEFETTPSHQGTFWVINNDHQSFTTTVSVGGELSQYVTLKTTELTFREDTDALPVEFSINLPAQIRPGESTANIVIEQSMSGLSANVISSKIVLKHKIIVQGPYPDKYVTTQLNFYESGPQIRLAAEVKNLGKQEVQQVQTKFYVNDKQQNQQVLETEKTSLQSKENKVLDARVDRKLFTQGEFEVLAVTQYDDQQVEVTKKLLVGRPEIDITYFDKYFIAQQVNPYVLELLNKWNTPIENVYVEVDVKKDQQKIDQFRTKSVDLKAETAKRVSDYFDAKNKNPGTYQFEMVVNFWNLFRMDRKTFTAELLTAEQAQNEEVVQKLNRGVGKATEIPAAATSSLSAMTILPWLIVAVLLFAIAGYVLYRYLHRDEYEKGGDAF